MGMIDILKVDNETFRKLDIDDECPICAYPFQTRKKTRKNKINKDNKKVTTINKIPAKSKLYSSMILDLDNDNDKIKKDKHNLSKSINFKLTYDANDMNDMIYDKEIMDAITKINKREVIPVRMSCCGLIICKKCFRKTIEKQNNLICSLCKTDHCRDELDYITVVEPGNYDYSKWIGWWNDHFELFL